MASNNAFFDTDDIAHAGKESMPLPPDWEVYDHIVYDVPVPSR